MTDRTPQQVAIFFSENKKPPEGWEVQICQESLIQQNDGWYKYSYLIKPVKIRRAYLKYPRDAHP